MIFGIKIIIENRELLFRLRKISLSSKKFYKKIVGIDGRIRNTTKVFYVPKTTFALIEKKTKLQEIGI